MTTTLLSRALPRTETIFLDVLRKAATQVAVVLPDANLAAEKAFLARRRTMGDGTDPVGTILLTETDGVLNWSESYFRPIETRQGRFRRSPIQGRIVEQFKFERLPPSQVGQFLSTLDGSLTPAPGMKQWMAGNPLQPVASPLPDAKRILLFVHGTLSRCEFLFDALQQTAEGKQLLGRASQHYDQILAFDYPTLSISPLLNAIDLARYLHGSSAAVDIVAHSGGGLVTRWWLDLLRPASAPRARAVLVGSPLAGTSLASPARLRAALNLITNLARGMALAGTAAAATPFLTAVVGLMKVLASITSVVASTPLADVGIALVPGLAGQSAVSNNAEILRLRGAPATPAEYFAVLTNFESEDPGWAFWKRFRKMALVDAGADLIFEGANDLVVDTASMTELAQGSQISTVFDYSTSASVHHGNYFSQAPTAQFIAQSFQL